jgi:hypothetical protein
MWGRPALWGDSREQSSPLGAGAPAGPGQISAELAATLGGPTPSAAGVTWEVDPTALVAFPKNGTEYGAFRAANSLAVATPNSLWTFQEASGNILDKIGALNLVAGGTPNYSQAVAGYSRVAVGFDDASSDKAVAASGSGPNPTTTSQTWLYFALMPATPGTTRAFVGINQAFTAARCTALHLTTSGGMRLNVVTNNTDDATNHSSQVIAVAVKYDRTNSVAALYTNKVKIIGTYSASVTDGDKGVGSAAGGMSGCQILWGCMWSGSAAEISDANMKALLTAHGAVFAPPWS